MSESLKARLESKAPRRGVSLVQVADPSPAQAALDVASTQLARAELAARAGDAAALAARDEAAAVRQAALADVAACFVEVEFVALPGEQMEALVDRFTTRSTGKLDVAAITPVLAARCAVDEELQDEAWWRDQLASPSWSQGDQDALRTDLLNLNWATPPDSLPKG